MMKTSSYESKIINILNKENIKYVREKTYPDLKYGYYRFDFYLKDYDTLIEVQGEQHFHFTKKFFKYKGDFLKAQERDRKKIEYCLAHKIKLIIIPFWDIATLTDVNSLMKKEYYATSKFHNDVIWRNYRKIMERK